MEKSEWTEQNHKGKGFEKEGSTMTFRTQRTFLETPPPSLTVQSLARGTTPPPMSSLLFHCPFSIIHITCVSFCFLLPLLLLPSISPPPPLSLSFPTYPLPSTASLPLSHSLFFSSFFRSLLFWGGKIIMRNACQVSGASQFKAFWERALNRDSKFR